MNKDMMQGQWKQMKGEVKRRWGMLTDDEIDQTEGSFEKLVGRIQERYGYEKFRAEQEINDFLHNYNAPATR